VPSQGMALEALLRLPPNESPLVFPNARGGHVDLHDFRQRYSRPALCAAGIEPLRQPYDRRHLRHFRPSRRFWNQAFAAYKAVVEQNDGCGAWSPADEIGRTRNGSHEASEAIVVTGQ
jgi:hypothetical protein